MSRIKRCLLNAYLDIFCIQRRNLDIIIIVMNWKRLERRMAKTAIHKWKRSQPMVSQSIQLFVFYFLISADTDGRGTFRVCFSVYCIQMLQCNELSSERFYVKLIILCRFDDNADSNVYRQLWIFDHRWERGRISVGWSSRSRCRSGFHNLFKILNVIIACLICLMSCSEDCSKHLMNLNSLIG